MAEHDGVALRLRLHIIPSEDLEVQAQRRFGDALQAGPALVTAYAVDVTINA